MQKHLSRTSALVVGCLAALPLLTLAGCTEGSRDSDTSGTPPKAAASPASITPEMPSYLEAVGQANKELESTVITAGARPTVAQQGSSVTTMVIRDGSQVIIIPAGSAQAAVAYQIQRL